MSHDYQHGIFIGRFQPIHKGHLKTIEKALEECAELIILIGSAYRPSTVRNPWSADNRRLMISKAIREYFGEVNGHWSDKLSEDSVLRRIKFAPLRDYLYNDYKWLAEVYTTARECGAQDGVHATVLYGSDKDDSSYYLKMFPHWTLKMQPLLHYNRVKGAVSSVHIRECWFEAVVEQSGMLGWIMPSTAKYLHVPNQYLIDEYNHYEDYRSEHEWVEKPYDPVFVTVDSLVIRSGCILVVKRGFHPGKGLYALPGGFLNSQERLKQSAIRELREETKIVFPSGDTVKDWNALLKDVQIFDHPMRSLRGRTITHVHLFDMGIGSMPQVEGADDAEKAFWMPIGDVSRNEDRWFEDHYDIIVQMTSKY